MKGQNMKNTTCFLIAMLCIAVNSGAAQAHFLFVRILPVAEGGRFAEVYFSDSADAGDPRFVSKIAATKLWAQTKPGNFEPLRIHATTDRLRAAVPATGYISVVGELNYGVLGAKKKPFLLRHYPKAVVGKPGDIGLLEPKKDIPLEIMLVPSGDGVEFYALHDGKWLANADFSVIAPNLKEQKLTAGKDGKAAWKPAAPGHYSVYTNRTLKQAGMHNGEKYDEIREFATIAFAWPLETKGADPKAVQLFQDAIDRRAMWHNFPGFAADVQANVDGRKWKGTATISAKGDVELSAEDDVVTPWVRGQFESMVLHRLAQPRGSAPILRFADDVVDNPLGRLLTFEGGAMASSYRVKDQQITVVNRAMSKVNFTITVIDNELNVDKKFLPRSYTVQYWTAPTGELQRTEAIQNRWTRLGSWDLPTLVTVQTSSSSGVSVKTMTLSGHRVPGVKTP
jgi:hypothetical protein